MAMPLSPCSYLFQMFPLERVELHLPAALGFPDEVIACGLNSVVLVLFFVCLFFLTSSVFSSLATILLLSTQCSDRQHPSVSQAMLVNEAVIQSEVVALPSPTISKMTDLPRRTLHINETCSFMNKFIESCQSEAHMHGGRVRVNPWCLSVWGYNINIDPF